MTLERKYYLDFLRVGAVLAVVLMHCSGHCDNFTNTNELQWHLCSIPQTGTYWAVPIFIMISGALMLNKEISLKILYSKYILRLLVAYVFWSFMYVLIFSILPYYDSFTLVVIKNIIAATLRGGYYHLWFMPLIIGLYVVIPIVQKSLRGMDAKTIGYWLITSFVFGSIFSLLRLFPLFDEILGESIETFNVGLNGQFLFYFVLGYILDRVQLPVKIRNLVYVLGILSMLCTFALVSVLSYHKGVLYDAIRSNKMPNVILTSIALFVWAKEYCAKKECSPKCRRILVEASACCFGVYFIHLFVLIWLEKEVLRICSPFTATFVLFVLATIISFSLVYGIRKIFPFSKYIT